MVGVVGSNPIVPTKQNPLCWRSRRAIREGRPFSFGNGLGKLWENPHRSELQVSSHDLVLDDLFAVSFLVMAGHFRVGMTHQRLNVILWELLLVI